MKKQLLVSATALALMMPYTAMADVNYSFVELDYFMLDDEADTDGIRLKGSLGFGDTGVFGFTEITNQDNDVNIVTLGGGYAHTVADGTDVFGGLTVDYIEHDVTGGEDETGFGVRLGVRSLVIPELELKGELIHVENDFLMDGDATAFDLGVQYLPIPEVGLIAEYRVQADSDDADSILLGARYNF